MVPAPSQICPACAAPIQADALSCPQCRELVHAGQFEQLTYKAKFAGQAGDWVTARDAWRSALALLPPGNPQYTTIQERIANIDAQLAAASQPHETSPWAKRAAKLGPAGVVLWKFKTITLIVLSKAKLLALGLTKMSTLLSMLASLGVYWAAFGWRFALGFVLSIYVHEMGHVAALRRYGIAATAPMFIPGFGAIVRLKQYPGNVIEDARVGLAGPIYGFGAAVACWIAGLLTGAPIWMALAKTGAWINLFNLIPIWQLDGGRGFRALTRKQRSFALATALLMWAVTEESMLLFIALGAGYRLFTKDAPDEPDNLGLVQYIGLVVLLSILVLLA